MSPAPRARARFPELGQLRCLATAAPAHPCCGGIAVARAHLAEALLCVCPAGDQAAAGKKAAAKKAASKKGPGVEDRFFRLSDMEKYVEEAERRAARGDDEDDEDDDVMGEGMGEGDEEEDSEGLEALLAGGDDEDEEDGGMAALLRDSEAAAGGLRVCGLGCGCGASALRLSCLRPLLPHRAPPPWPLRRGNATRLDSEGLKAVAGYGPPELDPILRLGIRVRVSAAPPRCAVPWPFNSRLRCVPWCALPGVSYLVCHCPVQARARRAREGRTALAAA